MSNSDKKQSSKNRQKAIGFFSSVLSESTPRDAGFSPQKSKLMFYNISLEGVSPVGNPVRPRKNSQVMSIGSDTRVYTPDQLHQIYDESICKYKSSNLNSSMVTKNSKKSKRGAKTSYGNYAQVQAINPFVTNKFKLQKARKSLISAGNSKKSILGNSSNILETFK